MYDWIAVEWFIEKTTHAKTMVKLDYRMFCMMVLVHPTNLFLLNALLGVIIMN